MKQIYATSAPGGGGGSPVTPAALTKTDDTNVTLTLGGTPATALLQAVSLTVGWTGTLADARIASAAYWNAKQNAITGAATTITTLDLTASRVLVSDASGKVAASSVTDTTLGYLDATSSIQTQLNAKSTLGFTLQGSWASTSPADSTTYYASLAPGTITLNTVRTNLTPIAIPKNCTLKSVSVNIIQGAASSETVTYNIDVNSVSTLIGTTNSTLTIITVSNYAMGVTCLQGQFLYLQIVTPAWVTNPVNMRGIFTCYFE